MRYRQCLRQRQCMETTVYSLPMNYIHGSLLKKEGAAFWKSWRSKFESTSKCTEVEDCSDQGVIADNFATHFSGCFTGNNRVETLKMEYLQMSIVVTQTSLPDSRPHTQHIRAAHLLLLLAEHRRHSRKR